MAFPRGRQNSLDALRGGEMTAISIKSPTRAEKLLSLINVELEAVALGCILSGGEPVFREANLSEEHFATEEGRVMFGAMRAIVDEVELTLTTVAARLMEPGEFEKVDDFAGLMDLHSKRIPSLRIAALAGTLRELSRKRKAWRTAALIREELSLGANADDEHSRELAQELAELASAESTARRI